MEIDGAAVVVTVTLAHEVVLQVPSARTKKVVLVLTATLESVAPVPSKAPPQLPLYHFQEAPVPRKPPVILKFTIAGPQLDVISELAETAATEMLLTVNVAVEDVTGPQLPVTTTS